MNAFEKAQEVGRDLKTAAGKAAMNFLPYVALAEVSKVASFGAAKYPPGWTWTKADDDWREKYGSAVARHVMKWLDPTLPNVDIDIDPVTGADVGSGLSHMAHAAFNAMICLWHEAREHKNLGRAIRAMEDSVLVNHESGRCRDGTVPSIAESGCWCCRRCGAPVPCVLSVSTSGESCEGACFCGPPNLAGVRALTNEEIKNR